jgi:hypothetical protein
MKHFTLSTSTHALFTFLLISTIVLPGACSSSEMPFSGLFIRTDQSSPAVLSAAQPAGPVSAESNAPYYVDYRAPFLFDVELVLDDGSAENNIGIGGTLELLWLNRFTPDPGHYPFNLMEISVYFDSDGLVEIGDNMILVVYENTSGNTDPANGSNFLESFPVTVQELDAWNTYDISTTPILFNGPGDVLIGVIALEVPGTSYWPAALDQTTTQERSWAGWWTTSPPPDPPVLPPDDSWVLIDSYFPGNWMVRGYGEFASSTPTPVPTSTPVHTPTPDCIHHGDVNLDGIISAADAQMAFYIVLGLHVPTYEEECAADCNADDIVSAADAQAIFLVVLGSGTCADPI